MNKTLSTVKVPYSRRAAVAKKRRNRELRRNILLTAFTVILFVSLAVLFFSTKSEASSQGCEELYKHYKSIQISSGDTLYSLSAEYVNEDFNNRDSFIKEVRYINNLEEDAVLYAGCYIVIPYYDTIHG